MKYGFLIILLHICFSSIAQTKKFEGGSFFTISYPSNFSILNPCKDPNYCNVLTVQSPDKTVEFFVYAPQWNGDPDIGVKAGEKETARKVTKQKGGIIVTEVTIAANNGRYTRSYVDTENTELNTRKCFGVQYKTMTAYNKYKPQYLAFKKSLEQFAD